MLQRISEEEFTAMQQRVGKGGVAGTSRRKPESAGSSPAPSLPAMKLRVRGGVVGTRHKVRQQLDPLKRATDAKSNIRPTIGTASRLCIKALGVTAGSNPAPSPYKSKWEASYAAKLELEKKAGLIKAWWYEPFSLWLPGKVRYKPDFMVEYNPVNPWGGQISPNIEIIEVKGWSPNLRDGMTRLKIAAALFPCFRWTLAYKVKGGGWEQETL